MADLKITRIDVFQVSLPHAHGPYMLSNNRTYTTFDSTIVRITTNTGIQGWGESCPFGATFIASHALGVRAGIAEIAPHLIGLDPRKVDRVNEAMDNVLLGNEPSKSALDVACWDIFGKSVGLPVCELLGGRRDKGVGMLTSFGVCSPDEMRRKVSGYRQKKFKGFSIKVQGDPAKDAALIAASMQDRQEGEFFLVDANTGLTPEVALRMLALLPRGLDFVLESPCASWREHLSLRRRTAHPMILDELATNEASLIQLIADDAADGINLKISKVGGLTRARRQRDICIAAGLTMAVMDTVGSDLAFAAMVHLACTIPERYLRCVLNTQDMVTMQTAEFRCIWDDDGLVYAPNVPGLGVEPVMEVLGNPVASYF